MNQEDIIQIENIVLRRQILGFHGSIHQILENLSDIITRDAKLRERVAFLEEENEKRIINKIKRLIKQIKRVFQRKEGWEKKKEEREKEEE